MANDYKCKYHGQDYTVNGKTSDDFCYCTLPQNEKCPLSAQIKIPSGDKESLENKVLCNKIYMPTIVERIISDYKYIKTRSIEQRYKSLFGYIESISAAQSDVKA